MISIKPFIFNWKGQYEKTKCKEIQLKNLGYTNLVIINSDENFLENSWVSLGEDAYFNKQFLSALSIFAQSSEDIFFHIQGDASYNNWEKLIEDAKFYFKQYSWGIYAPNVDYTWYSSDRTDVHSIPIKNHSNLKFIASPDCTCWFIHRDVINEFLNFKVNMDKYKFGWGWDIILPSISYIMKRPVLRDYSHTVEHPEGTGYNKEKAELEMIDLFNSLPNNLKVLFLIIKQDREKLNLIFGDKYDTIYG